MIRSLLVSIVAAFVLAGCARPKPAPQADIPPPDPDIYSIAKEMDSAGG